MKKITVIQASVIAVVALLAGLLIGASISDVTPPRTFLAGTFGTVSKYRKDNMTEKDVILRNELASDTARTSYNLKYYSYNYYKSLKTSLDIEKVIEKAASEEEFNNTYYTAVNALSKYKTYLDSVYILIEKGTTFPLKSIPLIEVKPVALRTQKQRKTDDKHGYQTRDYQTIFSGVR